MLKFEKKIRRQKVNHPINTNSNLIKQSFFLTMQTRRRLGFEPYRLALCFQSLFYNTLTLKIGTDTSTEENVSLDPIHKILKCQGFTIGVFFKKISYAHVQHVARIQEVAGSNYSGI